MKANAKKPLSSETFRLCTRKGRLASYLGQTEVELFQEITSCLSAAEASDGWMAAQNAFHAANTVKWAQGQVAGRAA